MTIKTEAENYAGTLSPTQAKLFGAGKEAIGATVTEKQAIADTAGKSAGIIRGAAARQAVAAGSGALAVAGAHKEAGTATGSAFGDAKEKLGTAYGAADKAYGAAGEKLGTAYGAADKAYGAAQAGLEGAYGQAQAATASRHKNALMDARMALAEQAMATMKRGRTTAGNLQATGTLGKQAAATRSTMASKMAQEQADLALGQARDVGQLGIQQAQYGVQGAGQLGQLGIQQGQYGVQGAGQLGQLGIQQAQQQAQHGIGGATALSQGMQAAAGFTAAGAKEAQAAELIAGEASYDAALARAEELGLDFFMNEQQQVSYQNKTNAAITDISTAQATSTEDGIVQAQAYMANLDMDNPADQILFENIFNQAMIKVDGFEPGSGMWTIDQATELAQALGPQQALAIMSSMPTFMGSWARPDGTGALDMDANATAAILQRAIETGGLDNMGILYETSDGKMWWANSEDEVPAYRIMPDGTEYKMIWTQK